MPCLSNTPPQPQATTTTTTTTTTNYQSNNHHSKHIDIDRGPAYALPIQYTTTTTANHHNLHHNHNQLPIQQPPFKHISNFKSNNSETPPQPQPQYSLIPKHFLPMQYSGEQGNKAARLFDRLSDPRQHYAFEHLLQCHLSTLIS